MQLAAEIVTITIGDDEFRLRPTLRAATRLHRKHGGFERMIRDIAECNVTTLVSILAETSSAPAEAARLVSLGEVPLARFAGMLQAPLLAVVLAMAGVDEGALSTGTDEPATPVEPVDFDQHFSKLYRIATGWLGWTPATAWDSTPAEIVEAYKGRIELLNSIFGTGEKAETDVTPEDKLRAIFATLGTRKAAA